MPIHILHQKRLRISWRVFVSASLPTKRPHRIRVMAGHTTLSLAKM